MALYKQNGHILFIIYGTFGTVSYAEKVFSGVRLAVYQWDQELYDGSVARFERARFLDGAFVIGVCPDGSILMTEQEQPARSSPFLSLPGGAFDTPDEDPLECAKRELFEETGYQSDEWKLWHMAEGTQNIITYTYYYIAYGCSPGAKHTNPDGGEKIRTYTVSFDELIDLCEDRRFTHWPLLPLFFEAKIHKEKYNELKALFCIH